uniref:S-linalool synthase n=1 Tax=Oryza barthii TaxID=65489 RepID=A0A0D3EZZ2_9ORYZ
MVCHVFSSFSSSLIRVLEAPLLLPAASASSSSSSPASRSGGRRRRAAHVRPSPAIYPGRQELASHSSMLPTDFDIQVLIERHEALTDDVQEMLQHQRRRHQKTASGGRERIATVDHLRRLCIDHYFQDEVDDAMDACLLEELAHGGDLLDATLAFRLMREAGHHVSADEVLGRFTDDNGEFRLDYRKDIRGLLSLQDISHMNIGQEASLCKAKEFSTRNLESAINYLEPNLARYVRQSLDHPYHVSLNQYKARHHLSYLQTLPIRCTAMEELALADFQLNKLLHQMEMQDIKRWWMDLGLAQEIPVARDQVQKWFVWMMTAIQGASLSRCRIELTKIVSFVYIVDDIFDLVGTREELSCFTQAIRMWDLAAADSLPSCMRSCFRALHTVTNDIADMVEREHGVNPINHLKKAWAMLFDGFMTETKWLSAGQVPESEEYLRNGVVTSGVPLVFVHLLFMLGHDVSQNAAEFVDHIPPVISCPAKILRLWDDLGSAKDEAQEGLDGSYKELYLKENPGLAAGEAEEHVRRLIAGEWEELNRECFSASPSRSSPATTFPAGFTQAALNAARMVGVMYGYDGERRLPVLDVYVRMLLF